MSRACFGGACAQYSDAYESDGVSQYARKAHLEPKREVVGDRSVSNSVSIGHRYATLFDRIIAARASAEFDNWDGEGAPAIGQRAVDAAIAISCALPSSIPMPQVQAESTGEVSFEWYKDKRHVAVLAVDGDSVRWSGIVGTDATRSGVEPYRRLLPMAALDVVREVIG